MNSCCICGQIAGDPCRDLLHRTRGARQYERWIPRETERFVVIPSIGALVPGHVLLSPRRHVRSSALLSSSEAQEMERTILTLESELEDEFGGPVQLFEHGNSERGTNVGCSVEHAHLHFVPGAPDVSALIADDLPWVEVTAPIASVARGREYIRYRSGDGRWLVCASGGDGLLPSQHLRKRFAQALGIPNDWNWRVASRIAVTQQTLDRLRARRAIAA